MINLREQAFEKKLAEINKLVVESYQKIKSNRKLHVKKTNQENFFNAIKNLDFSELENTYQSSFISWIINKFAPVPCDLIANLKLLHDINYTPHFVNDSEMDVISQICTKPNAITILNSLFTKLTCPYNNLYQLKSSSIPPCFNVDFDSPLFLFLLENHEQYSLRFSPLFWAIENERLDLIEKILQVMPAWVNGWGNNSLTPLMYAIYNQKEKSVLKLIEFRPDIHLKNFKKETIAHMLCCSMDKEWMLKIKNDSHFAYLDMEKMLADETLLDMNNLLPLCYAFYRGHITFVQEVFEKAPNLQSAFMQFFKQVITYNNPIFLNSLCLDLKLDIFAKENQDLLCYLLASCVDNNYLDSFNWFLSFCMLNYNIRNIFLAYSYVKNRSFEFFSNYLNAIQLDWNEIPADLCFSITRFLIENDKYQLIIDIGLFDRHPNFHRLMEVNSKEITHTAISIIPNIQEKHYGLLNYFLNYIDRHQAVYPKWLAEFDNHLSIYLTKFPIDKNRMVHGEPLIHFLENHYFCASLTNPNLDWLKQIMDFVNFRVNINAFGVNQKHLFAKLIDDEEYGFERIQKLKTQFPQIILENLDGKGSNLLHLAIQKNHQKCIAWCLKNNVDVCTPRTFDNQSPMEMVFEIQNFELLNNMRKFVKKSQFIEYFKHLILQQKDAFIDFLLSIPKPFGWEITIHHQDLLRKIPHEGIQNFLKQFEKKAEPIVIAEEVRIFKEIQPAQEKPKMIVNHDFLLKIIREGRVKSLEELLDSSYQDSLKILFDEHFMIYLREVFHSSNKSLNKTFIRFPDAQFYMTNSDTCHALFSDALEIQNKVVVENMLGREFVLKILKTQAFRHLKTAFRCHPESYAKQLLTIFELSLNESKDLLFYISELKNKEILNIFFEMENQRQVLKYLDDEECTTLFKQEYIFQNLMKYKDTQHDVMNQLIPSCLKLIQENQFNAVQGMLNIPKFRAKIFEDKHLLEELKSTEMFSLLLPFLDKEATHVFFEDALKTKNKAVVTQMLENEKIYSVLKVRAREYLQFVLTFCPNFWTEPLFKIFQLSDEELKKIWLFSLVLEDEDAIISFLNIPRHHQFLQNADMMIWRLVVSKGTKVIEFLLSHKELSQALDNQIYSLFINALKENHLSTVKVLLSFPIVRAKIFNDNLQFIIDIDTLRLMYQFIPLVESFSDIPWDLFFIYGLKNNNKHIILNMINNETIKLKLQENALKYVQFVLHTYPKLYADMMLDAFILNTEELKFLWSYCLDNENFDALFVFLRRSEIYLILENASMETWTQLFVAKTLLMQAFLASPNLQKIVFSQTIPCFNHALEKNDLSVLFGILYFTELRRIIKNDVDQILRQASTKSNLNGLIDILRHYPQDFVSVLRPYVPVGSNRLPVEIEDGFNRLGSENRATYLVGSAVHCLVKGTSLEGINDIDFISSHEPPKESDFIQSRVQPKLFFSNRASVAQNTFFKTKPLKIECFVNAHNPEHFIAEDYLQRDFTVNCLYADSKGYIYDPTGLGIGDLENGIIRCVKNNPLESFNDDPIRILRAIRLMVKGYHLMPDVSQAIFDWHPNERVNYGHVYAMTKSLLLSEYKEHIFYFLQYFGLVKKLLGFEENNPQLERLIEFVKGEVSRDVTSPLSRRSPLTYCNSNPQIFQLNSSSNVHNGHNSSGNFFNGI